MAGRIALDLKQFKHMKSDDKTTMLQHNDGHVLTLAHKALSPENQDQLKALAKMGDSKKSSDKEDKKPATVKAKSSPEGVEKAKELRKDDSAEHGATIMLPDEEQKLGKIKGPDGEKPKVFAQGGPVQQYAEGGDIPEALQPSPEQAPAPQMPVINVNVGGQPAQAQSAPAQQQLPKSPTRALSDEQWAALPDSAKQGFLDPMNAPAGQSGGEGILNKLGEMKQAASAAKAQELAQAGVAPAPGQVQVQKPQLQEGTGLADLQKLQGGAPAPAPIPEQAPSNATDWHDPASLALRGAQEQVAGINADAAAKGALGERSAEILNKQVEAETQAKAAFQQQYNSLEAERQGHMADIKNGHIDPEQYWKGDKNGNGSHSKIAAGIGMILAGFNPTASPNAAVNFLKYQMDQNIDAQKQNLASDQNLLAANLRQFGNLKDATDMTRLMQADVVHNDLMSAAAKAQTPMAKAAALQAAGQIKAAYAPISMQMSMRRSMMQLANNGGNGDPSDTSAAEQMISMARMTNPEMAKEMESRLIPGVGMAKKPVPEGVVKELTAKRNLDMAAKDVYDYAKNHSNLVPGTAEYNIGVQKAVNLQQLWREGVLNTVFREGEQPLMHKVIDENPAGLMKRFGALPKLKELIESNERSNNVLKQSYGIPTKQPAMQPVERIDKATGKTALFDPTSKKFLGYK